MKNFIELRRTDGYRLLININHIVSVNENGINLAGERGYKFENFNNITYDQVIKKIEDAQSTHPKRNIYGEWR